MHVEARRRSIPWATAAGAIPAVLLAAAALCWVVTADRMGGMDMGPGTDLGSLGWFAGVWAVMMAAMMLLSLVPMAGAYARREADEGGRARSASGTFLFTLAIWRPGCWQASRPGRRLRGSARSPPRSLPGMRVGAMSPAA